MSKSLDPDPVRCFVGPGPGQNCHHQQMTRQAENADKKLSSNFYFNNRLILTCMQTVLTGIRLFHREQSDLSQHFLLNTKADDKDHFSRQYLQQKFQPDLTNTKPNPVKFTYKILKNIIFLQDYSNTTFQLTLSSEPQQTCNDRFVMQSLPSRVNFRKSESELIPFMRSEFESL